LAKLKLIGNELIMDFKIFYRIRLGEFILARVVQRAFLETQNGVEFRKLLVVGALLF